MASLVNSSKKTIYSKKQLLPVILLMALVLVRILAYKALIPHPEIAHYYNDSLQYSEYGDALLDGSAYHWKLANPLDLKRTIGYPFFLAGIGSIWGTDPIHVAVIQLLLSGLVGILLYFYLQRFVGTWAALITAILFLCDPLTLVFSLQIMTENLFTFTMLISFGFLILWMRGNRVLYLLLAGLFLGATCLVRPIGQMLIALWGLAVVIYSIGNKQKSKRLNRFSIGKNVFVFLLPIALLLIPWVIRNSIVWDCPAISGISRYNLREYVAAEVLSQVDQVPVSQSVAQLAQADPGYCPHNSAEYYGIVLQHPFTFLKLFAAGTVNVFGFSSDTVTLWLSTLGYEYHPIDLWQPFLIGGAGQVIKVLFAEFKRSQTYSFGLGSLLLFQLMMYLFTILGLLGWRHKSSRLRWEMALALVTGLALMLTPGVLGDARFRVPAQPFLFCIAGFGIAWIFARLKSKKTAGEIEAKSETISK
jgi:4-amino-4-deoxy-L-arabinose transferase-like glycosyltransferase